jgi:hypothetical protein
MRSIPRGTENAERKKETLRLGRELLRGRSTKKLPFYIVQRQCRLCARLRLLRRSGGAPAFAYSYPARPSEPTTEPTISAAHLATPNPSINSPPTASHFLLPVFLVQIGTRRIGRHFYASGC